jgi:AraC-like DNA-binding protein
MLKEVTHQLKSKASDFDVLDDVINTLRFRGSIFFHSSLAAPWGMSLSPMSTPRFHIALEGSFYIGTENDQASVNAMDIVMLPGGGMHWIADQLHRELVPSEDAGEACELGIPLFQKGDITNRVMCGLVHYDDIISHPIISALPSIFHLSNIQADDSIWVTVKLIDAEITRTGRNNNTIIDRLTEILFIQLLNNYASENENLTGFFGALNEPRIGNILQLIHRNPEKKWTLDMLGEEAGMSRATLQRKFKAGLGVSPMTYLSRWRMAKAYQLLKRSSQSLDAIAEVTGFADARTLRTAFQRHYGFTPSALRKNN